MDKRNNIIILDDDRMLRKTLVDILSARGYRPLEAARGKVALAQLKEENPAVVLIDQKLEDMPGLKVLEEIKKLSPSTECIMLTGYASQASAIEAINLGAYSYIPKPYDMEQLLITISRALEKQETEEAIRISARQWQTTFDAIPDALCMLDLESNVLRCNKAMAKMLEKPVNEVVGRKIWTLMSGKMEPSEMSRLGQKHEIGRNEIMVLSMGNRFFSGSMDPVLDDDGNTSGTVLILSDITDRKITEDKLRESEEKYRLHFETVNDVIYSVDSELCITSVSPSIKGLLGYLPAEIIGKSFGDQEHMAPESLEQAFVDTKRVLSGEKVSSADYEFIAKDGSRRFVEVGGAPLIKDGKVVSALSIARDITERKRLEEEILGISEREKRQIGQDLHDGLGQLLTGISFMSKRLEQDLLEKSLGEATVATKITSLIGESITQARDIAKGLYPVELEIVGIAEAMEQLVISSAEMFNVSCHFMCKNIDFYCDHSKSIHLYRIAQEAIHNAVRHGKADLIEIHLDREEDRLRLIIQDDGIGIPSPLEVLGGMGLRIMKYRAGMIGASLDVRRANGGGTMVNCWLKE